MFGAIVIDHVISESCYKGAILRRNYRKIGSHYITVIYPNPCHNKVCYKGTALYKCYCINRKYWDTWASSNIYFKNSFFVWFEVLHPNQHLWSCWDHQFMISLRKSTGPGWDQTCDPWICRRPRPMHYGAQCWVGSFVIFHGIWTSIPKETYSFVIFQGGNGLDPKYPRLWIHACVLYGCTYAIPQLG